MKDLVVLKENNAVTTSLMVAEVFGKRHDNVIRAIDQIKADSVEIPNALNFEEADFIDKNGENRRSYEMGRDAFMLLAMGFTGKEALKFKLMFIDAFNKMEAALASGGQLVPVRGYTRRQLAKPTFKPKGFNEVQRREMGGIVKAALEAMDRKAASPSLFAPPRQPDIEFDFGKNGDGPVKVTVNGAENPVLGQLLTGFGRDRYLSGRVYGTLDGAFGVGKSQATIRGIMYKSVEDKTK